jgi:hypothetical protein
MNLSDLSHKKWFSWIILVVLLVSNIISYKIAENYFSMNGLIDPEDVRVENSMLGSGSRLIDWAKDILRFFRNP